MVIDQVEEHHDGETTTLHLLCIGVDDVLLQMETLVSDFYHSRTGSNMVAPLNLGNELGIDLYHNDCHLLPIHILADGSKVVGLCCIVELEIDGIVHVSELIHVVESDLNRQDMPEAIVSFLCHL